MTPRPSPTQRAVEIDAPLRDGGRQRNVGGRRLPSLHEFVVAHKSIAAFIPATPFARVDRISETCGLEFVAKRENLSPVRSFKLRGAFYRIDCLSEAERKRGIVTSSTGNHAIAVAYAARNFGVDAVVVVPHSAPGMKARRATALGADVRTVGTTMTEAEEAAREIADVEGRILIQDGSDAEVMIGAGTLALEIHSAIPEASLLLVPVGGGGLIAGIAACAKQLNPRIRVVGVQSEAAPAVHESWKRGEMVSLPCRTFASGLATEHPGAIVLDVILKAVDEIVLVSENELRHAMVLALNELGEVVEAGGAASLAAVKRYGARWRGEVVVGIITGGNADAAELYQAMRLLRPQSALSANS